MRCEGWMGGKRSYIEHTGVILPCLSLHTPACWVRMYRILTQVQVPDGDLSSSFNGSSSLGLVCKVHHVWRVR